MLKVLRWVAFVFVALNATRMGAYKIRSRRFRKLRRPATSRKIPTCRRALVRIKPFAIILDPSNHAGVIARVHLEEREGPPNWVLITALILFREQENVAKVLLFVALRIRRLAIGMIGVVTIAVVELIWKNDSSLVL